MPEMHLKQLGFTCSTSGPFTKNKERVQKFKETGDSQSIYQNKLYKACFKMTWLLIASDKVLHDKAFNTAKNLKYNRYERGL